MKTYNERLRSIQKKARAKKIVRAVTRTAISVFCLAVIVCAAVLLPQADQFFSMIGTIPNQAYGSATDTRQENPTTTNPDITIIDPPVVITSPTSPGNTQGPPNDSEIPYMYLDFEAHYLRASDFTAPGEYPATHLIRSVEDMTAFCTAYAPEYQPSGQLKEHVQKYGPEYFDCKSLIVLMLLETSGSVRHHVANVAMYSNNVVNVELERIVPEIGTDDIACWYIFVEVDAQLPDDTYVCHKDTPVRGNDADKLADSIPEDVKDLMKYAFIKQFTSPYEAYTADDVSIERVIAVFDDRYVLFVDGIFLYLEWLESETVNGYVFNYGSSQKLYLYADGYYYQLQEACDLGLLSDAELQRTHDAYCDGYWRYD